ncbi:hypothetical protein [uncultured Thiohalocapsa sp.]|jgi:hypothetical protein|uniref:hypothetical protein n=1 Tax=uncultured Thiohalocapsa sp. TaxID=768990 RepID=UPI0025E80C31|nr:hypothetical protein [uncultured Thiohalocapsa sp.]
MQSDTDEQLDQALARFAALIGDIHARQAEQERRVNSLFALSLVAFVLVVTVLSFLTIILSQQVPGMTAAIADMNGRFAVIADDMVAMDGSVADMRRHMASMPDMVAHLDAVHGSVGFMSADVGAMGLSVAAMDDSVAAMSASLGDMRLSFEVMEQRVARMGADMRHLSQPMRMFNFFNPFR